MKSKSFYWLALLAAVLSFAGCASLQQAKDIEVSLVDLRFEEATPLESTAIFTIRVQNQRPLPLATDGSVHKIYLNEVYIGSGVSNEPLELPRLSEGTQTVRVHLRNLSVARLVRDIVEQRRVAYRLDSRIYAKAEGRASTVHVTSSGTLALSDFQPSRLRDN